MTTRLMEIILLFAFALLMPMRGFADQAKHDAARTATREQLRQLLDTEGPKIDVAFKQNDKNPFNFVGIIKTGLKNSDELEIVVTVTASSTLAFHVYPHYQGKYINVDKVVNPKGLMKKLLQLSDTNFMFWGADDTGDIFSGYSITLESGFPSEALDVIIRSIPNQDQFVGQMKPFVDGKPAS